MNKHAQLFGIYLVVLTIFMCGLVILMYVSQNNSIQNSIVSPAIVIQVLEEKNAFEIQEQSIIAISARDAGWGSDNFALDVKKNFCNYFIKLEQKQMRDFLFNNLNYLARSDWKDSFSDEASQKNFCNDIYSFSFENNKLKFNRLALGKTIILQPSGGNDKIQFLVDFNYNFSKEQFFSEEDII